MRQLKYKILKQWDGIDQEHAQIQAVDDMVSWKVTPTFSHTGRSAWKLLDEPIKVQTAHGEIMIESLKIKGVGLYDHSGELKQPSDKAFHRANPHLGITKDGRFITIHTRSSPLGGLELTRACIEFDAAHILIQKGCPSEVPIRVYQYLDPDLFFEPEEGTRVPLAVVIAGLPQDSYLRGSSAVKYAKLDEKKKADVDEFARRLGVSTEHESGLPLLNAIFRSYGRQLRQFNLCGFYRNSGHPVNMACSKQIGDIFFTDLDSPRPLTECSEIEAPLQLMRDVASGLFYLTSCLVDPSNILNFPVEEVVQANHFHPFLSSYFHDVPTELIDCLIPVLQEYYLTVYNHVMAEYDVVTIQNVNPRDAESFQKYYWKYMKETWIKREEIYSWLMSVIWPLYHASELNTLYPLKTSQEELYKNLAAYSSPELMETIQKRIAQALG